MKWRKLRKLQSRASIPSNNNVLLNLHRAKDNKGVSLEESCSAEQARSSVKVNRLSAEPRERMDKHRAGTECQAETDLVVTNQYTQYRLSSSSCSAEQARSSVKVNRLSAEPRERMDKHRAGTECQAETDLVVTNQYTQYRLSSSSCSAEQARSSVKVTRLSAEPLSLHSCVAELLYIT
ncbi:hypothetical protein J6590_016612 [Homalodisca vitripennis]|nr:hypothetical protein J6590_016612 [Homalodisca vitripennis]